MTLSGWTTGSAPRGTARRTGDGRYRLAGLSSLVLALVCALALPASEFSVRLVTPSRMVGLGVPFPAHVEVRSPPGTRVARVELYVDRALRATLYEPPFTLDMHDVPAGPFAVTAVAYLEDGQRAEAVHVANTMVPPARVDVHEVELWAGVFDRRNRAVRDLGVEHFTVLENGVPQTIARFRLAPELPVHVGLLIDVSPTMEQDGALSQALSGAETFLDDVLRPQDRAGLFTFREHPDAVVSLGSDLDAMRAGLARVTVDPRWAGTAILDSIAATVPRFVGHEGRRALLVITDGLDNRSRYRLADTVRAARQAHVRIYVILVGRGAFGPDLVDLARETGGLSHHLRHPVALRRIYRGIADELRTQYVVGYNSSWAGHDDQCRTIQVMAVREGRAFNTRAMRGYCP